MKYNGMWKVNRKCRGERRWEKRGEDKECVGMRWDCMHKIIHQHINIRLLILSI